MPLFLPSPAHGVWYLGPIPVRGYALSILTGIIVAFFLARHRWKKWGHDAGQLENIILVSVILGIVGARIYWVAIEWPRYFGPDGTWYRMFYVWEGGLGIWGGIAAGFLSGAILARKYHIRFLELADCIAPAFLIAQGIGRLGNWWNQELYGYPTTLPWGLEIDPAHRMPGFEQYATFHPTFLYEMLWNFAGAAVLLLLEKKLKLNGGKVFALYITIYATGRFLVELLRTDPVAVIAGLRINSWVTLAGGVFGIGLLLWLSRRNRRADHTDAPVTADDTPADADVATPAATATTDADDTPAD